MSKTGFEQRPLPPFTRWWQGTWERILLAGYHPEGQRRLRKGRRRLGVELEDGRARAELQLAVAYGRVLPEVAAAVQERVADALARMCDVAVDSVDVTIEELVH